MLSELFEALSSVRLVFEVAADAMRVSGAAPLLRDLATWRSERSVAFDLAGLDGSLTGAPAASLATLRGVAAFCATGDGATTGAAAGGTLGGVAVGSVAVCAAAL